ncbi:CAP domain-containing protein [Specibacter sp. NPDC078709]|uniref:CAP domain-containing protein n=1 Tax=Specibacter sp. NPDC078709 TaxID=3154364 RepID=UPI00342EA365
MAKLHRPDYGTSLLPAGFDTYSKIIGINNTAEQIVDWWMNSPGHRAALMDKRFTDFGLGYIKTSKAGWSGMTVVAGNLARYPAKTPTPAPTTPVAPAPTPTPAPTTPAPSSGPVLAAGDVAAVNSASDLYAYPSAKGGDLWKSKFISAGWSGVQQLTVVDYNNDGRQDLVAVWADGRLTASFGQANGTLKAAQKIGSGWGPFEVVITKWKSGSVYPSIVAKSRTTGQLFLYPNLDGIRFGARQQIGNGWGSLTIIAADFDGDKKQDLLARTSAGKLLLYRGNGSGGFISEARRVVGTGWGSMTHLSGIANHVGAGSYGVLARSNNGNLLYYPILRNSWGSKLQIGTGGWSALKLGS